MTRYVPNKGNHPCSGLSTQRDYPCTKLGSIKAPNGRWYCDEHHYQSTDLSAVHRKFKKTKKQVAQAMILVGKTNEEVLEALVRHWDVDPKKGAAFVKRCRTELVRNKWISAEVAERHAH